MIEVKTQHNRWETSTVMNSIAHLIQAYKAIDSNESAFQDIIEKFLAANTDIFSRKNFSGHITASAFVLNKARTHALLVHHAKLHKWVQPGGHVEATDANVQLSAIREVNEETGITDLVTISSRIFDIDVHEIPENRTKGEPAHFHFDIRFLLAAQTDHVVISDESTDIRWAFLTELATLPPESIRRMAHKALLFLQHSPDSSNWLKTFLQPL